MNERISNVIKDPKFLPISIGIVSFGVGVGVGTGISYILNRRKKTFGSHKVEYVGRDLTSEEIEELRKAVDDTIVPNGAIFDTVDELAAVVDENNDDDAVVRHPSHIDPAEFIAQKLKESMTTVDESEDEEPDLEERNIFAGADDDWDLEEELKGRGTDQPYILHKDEFYAEESGLSQFTLSYYEGDDIMADEDDKPVYNYIHTTGPLKFGHGSGDPNVFYVRNAKFKAEYEILKVEGLFSVEVLGLEIANNERVKNIQHSRLPKFRPSD